VNETFYDRALDVLPYGMAGATDLADKITALHAAELAELRADRDGYRNGQQQVQFLLDAALDDKLALVRDGKKLLAERDALRLAGDALAEAVRWALNHVREVRVMDIPNYQKAKAILAAWRSASAPSGAKPKCQTCGDTGKVFRTFGPLKGSDDGQGKYSIPCPNCGKAGA